MGKEVGVLLDIVGVVGVCVLLKEFFLGVK